MPTQSRSARERQAQAHYVDRVNALIEQGNAQSNSDAPDPR
ncbi:MAG: hypothetical protein JWN95_4032 [Frankiales bacterium]|nr:hypothetical protein [Frankiales bacterium]